MFSTQTSPPDKFLKKLDKLAAGAHPVTPHGDLRGVIAQAADAGGSFIQVSFGKQRYKALVRGGRENYRADDRDDERWDDGARHCQFVM